MKKLIGTFFLIFIFFLFIAGLMISCKKNNTCYKPIEKTLSLGVILPMDNENGPLREKALRMAVDEINMAGGVGNGYTIQLIVKSDGGANREEAAVAAANEIIAGARDLVGFITSFSSSSRGVVSQVAIPGRYPVISGSATAEFLSGISFWFQRLAPPDGFEASILSMQAKKYNITLVAIAVEEGDSYSEELAARFRQEFGPGAGMEIKFKKDDPDLDIKVNLLLSGSPGALFISMLNPGVYNPLIQKLSELNGQKNLLNMHFILCDALNSGNIFQSSVGFMIGDLNGFPKNFGAMPSPDTASSIFQFFALNLKKKYNQNVGSYNAQFYDAGYLYALAMQKAIVSAGLADMNFFRETVNSFIRSVSHGAPGDPPVMPNMGWKAMKSACDFGGINYDGASGNCDMDPKGNVITPYSIFKIVDNGGTFGFKVIEIIRIP